MPLVEFVDKQGNKRSQRMFTPKRIQDIQAWVKEARKVIPAIPNPNNSDWRMVTIKVEVRWIILEFVNSVNERARMTIDRQKPAF